MAESANCKSCGAPIEWTLTEHGKRMPVDSEPVEGGNILLSHRTQGEPAIALYQSAEQIEQLRAQHERSPQEGPLRLFVSHFASCPHAAQHRRATVDVKHGDPLAGSRSPDPQTR